MTVGFSVCCSAQDFTGLFEGDCYPPGFLNNLGGDGLVRQTDCSLITLYSLGIRTPPTGFDFAAADCAPRATSGDGVITAADVVQCYRYLSGLDARQQGGGPTNLVSPRLVTPLGPERTLSISGTNMLRGRTNTIIIVPACQGDERTFAFTLQFDTNQLRIKRAFTYTNESFGNVTLNTTKTNDGLFGALFCVGISNSPVYRGELIRLDFVVSSNAGPSTTISFGDTLAIREIVNGNADVLQSSFQDGVIHFFDFRLDAPKVVPQGFEFTLTGIPGVYAVETSSDLTSWRQFGTLTNSTGATPFVDTSAEPLLTRFYRARFLPQSLF